MTRALVYHELPLVNAFEKRIPELNVIEATSPDAVHSALPDSSIFITNPTNWQDSFLEHLSAGDWIQTTSTGYAAFPIEKLRARDVTLTSAAAIHDSVVSEHALALALALSRNLDHLIERQQQHDWSRTDSTELWDWKGKQMTVYGLGNIGSDVARRGDAFGMEVFGVKRTPATYTGHLSQSRIRAPDEFHDLLPTTDLLVLTVPLTQETKQLVDEEVLEELPDSAVLVNVARGPVVDQEALVESLERGGIHGAGIDVTNPEPLPPDSPLWDMENVIITPHLGGRSRDFPVRFAELFIDNYQRWRDDRPFVNLIT
jgi:D-2-hydroxyacid dehydrogenase (NADP+)